jgi:hypothetical protein
MQFLRFSAVAFFGIAAEEAASLGIVVSGAEIVETKVCIELLATVEVASSCVALSAVP